MAHQRVKLLCAYTILFGVVSGNSVKHCRLPPNVPKGAVKEIIVEPLKDVENFPNTIITYSCLSNGYAFDYSISKSIRSHAFAQNIKSINLTCNTEG
jgi:hypothetical protein